MVQFNFRFQKILDLKENEKEIAKVKVADAINREEEELRRNVDIYNKIVDIDHLKKEKQQKGVPISELRMLGNYIDHLQDLLVSSNSELKRK